jgi:hypothetical protein
VSKDVDRTYRTNPQWFGANLTRQILADSDSRMAKWEARGQLPLFIRIKNRFVRNKVVLRGDR